VSPVADESPTVELLRRRLAREKSARLQAESIAERVTSERWQLRQRLEEKLALRTSELEAARLAATEAITAGRRFRASVTHELRTALTALIVHADSLRQDEPLRANDIQKLKDLLSQMHGALEAGREAPPTEESTVNVSDVIAEHEASWQQLAARAGKLLILDVDDAASAPPTVRQEDIAELVLDVITTRLPGPDPVIEIRVRASPDGLDVT
jgi:signal transduction histidine kinase